MMLNTKSIYLICLLHRVNELFNDNNQSNKFPSTEAERNKFIACSRLNNYLNGNMAIRKNLDDESIVSVLEDLTEYFNLLKLPKRTKMQFPRNLRQFNKAYWLWLKEHDIKR